MVLHQPPTTRPNLPSPSLIPSLSSSPLCLLLYLLCPLLTCPTLHGPPIDLQPPVPIFSASFSFNNTLTVLYSPLLNFISSMSYLSWSLRLPTTHSSQSSIFFHYTLTVLFFPLLTIVSPKSSPHLSFPLRLSVPRLSIRRRIGQLPSPFLRERSLQILRPLAKAGIPQTSRVSKVSVMKGQNMASLGCRLCS